MTASNGTPGPTQITTLPSRPQLWPPIATLVASSIVFGLSVSTQAGGVGVGAFFVIIAAIVWIMRRAMRRSQKGRVGKFVTAIVAGAGAATVAFTLLIVGTGIGGAFRGAPSTPANGAVNTSPGGDSIDSANRAPKPAEFGAISEREYAQIVANPDDHRGKALVIYGEVTQFDSRTGAAALRADTGGERVQASSASGYISYPHNSVLSGAEAILGGLVQDDVFEARVTVTGGYSYESTANSRLTVPRFEVHSVSIIGGDNAQPLPGKRDTPLQIGNLAFNVSDLQKTKTLKSSYDALNGDFVVITLTFENQAKQAFTLDDGDFNLVESDGTSYRPLDSAYRWIDDDVSHETVNPKSTFKGRLIFEIPANVSHDQLSLQVTDGSQQGLISLTK